MTETTRQHSEQFLLRLTPDEARIVRENAQAVGLTPQAYLRLVIRTVKAVHIEADRAK